MGEQIQKSREWAAQLVEKARSSSRFQEVVASPRIVTYGAALLVLTILLVVRATQYFAKVPISRRPSRTDLEKKSFKAPSRKPGGIDPPSPNNFHTNTSKYGNLWNSNGQQPSLLKIGTCIPRNQLHTGLSDMALTISPWDYEI